MSMLNPRAKAADLGEVIATTREYEVAQKTVSKLIAAEVPARDIAIVGEGVRTVERVTGKLGYASAARSGAINGVLIGLLLSAIMLFGTPDAQLTLFLGFVLVGVALGMIMSLITYTIVRRRRDFASMTQMLAEHYEVRVQSASLVKARQALGTERPAATRPPVDLSQPPQYGERVPAAEQGRASGQVVPPKPPMPGAGVGAGAGAAPDAVDAPPAYGERIAPAADAGSSASDGAGAALAGGGVDAVAANSTADGAGAVAREDSGSSPDSVATEGDDSADGSGDGSASARNSATNDRVAGQASAAGVVYDASRASYYGSGSTQAVGGSAGEASGAEGGAEVLGADARGSAAPGSEAPASENSGSAASGSEASGADTVDDAEGDESSTDGR